MAVEHLGLINSRLHFLFSTVTNIGEELIYMARHQAVTTGAGQGLIKFDCSFTFVYYQENAFVCFRRVVDSCSISIEILSIPAFVVSLIMFGDVVLPPVHCYPINMMYNDDNMYV